MTGSARLSEPAFNQAFGRLLLKRNPLWGNLLKTESSNVLVERSKRPDILLDQGQGNPVSIETEYAPARTVEADAKARIGQQVRGTGTPIEQALAIRIPVELRDIPLDRLDGEIEKAAFEFAVFTATEEGSERFPATGWSTSGLDGIARAIEISSLSERLIAKSLSVMETKVSQAAKLLERDLPDFPDPVQNIAKALWQEDGEQTRRMAMAILANAMVFHQILAGQHGIRPLRELEHESGKIPSFRMIAEWNRILNEVNYWPIFHIATSVLSPIKDRTAAMILQRLMEAVNELSMVGITTIHDLAGRMFQRLITDRKFLASFYTLPEGALLLAELAVARLDVDWSSEHACADLKVADFACGTGTLLSAAYQSVIARARQGGQDDRKLHARMMENGLIGIDIMPAATHLTTSQLASAHPSTTFKDTKIYTMPYGMDEDGERTRPGLGSLDLIEGTQQRVLFSTGMEQVRGTGTEEVREALGVEIPWRSIDLVIMNPPFTRPTGHEAKKKGVPVPSFAGFRTSEEEQRRMSRQLAKVTRKLDRPAGHGNAGLASNFIDLANQMVRDDGCIALVLPVTFASGRGWKAARELLARNYRGLLVVSIAAAGGAERAFSDDTGMAECLVVATRRRDENRGRDRTLFVNLHRRPRSLIEGLRVSEAIGAIHPDSPRGDLVIGEEAVGNYLRGSLLEDGGCVQIRNTGVIESCRALAEGRLHLPRVGPAGDLPVARLGDLGDRGPYHQDISGPPPRKGAPPRGPFDVAGTRGVPEFPMLWNHDAARERTLVVEPDAQGAVREGQEERARRLWAEHAARLHFNRDFRVNSQSLAACVTPGETLGGRAWPGFRLHDPAHEAPVLLWANSTLGIMSFWWRGTRQQAGRSILGISSLPDLPTIDARKLTNAQMKKCGKLFDAFSSREFLPAHEACRDPARIALDEALLTEALGLPRDLLGPLSVLREQWCDEPTVHGGKARRTDEG